MTSIGACFRAPALFSPQIWPFFRDKNSGKDQLLLAGERQIMKSDFLAHHMNLTPVQSKIEGLLSSSRLCALSDPQRSLRLMREAHQLQREELSRSEREFVQVAKRTAADSARIDDALSILSEEW